MLTVSRLCALWIGTDGWFSTAVAMHDPQPAIYAGNWTRQPLFADPAALVTWAVSVAKGAPVQTMHTNLTVTVKSPRDRDNVLRFALLLGPDACEAFELATKPDGEHHPWAQLLQDDGWTVRTKRFDGPWLTIESHDKDIEIGICMVGWLSAKDPQAYATLCANSGIALNRVGRPDAWGTMWVHGQYRYLTGWPLSAGAGMAAIKGFKRYTRDQNPFWAPKPEYWAQLPFLGDGEGNGEDRTQRPWHVHWTSYPAPPADASWGDVVLWDANAAYLNAWTTMRVARGALVHTGALVQPRDNGSYPAGYYHISALRWSPDVIDTALRLPPVWGSRTPYPDGSVWVTHITLDLIRSLRFDREYKGPQFTILDSWSCADDGQLAKPWGAHLKDALTAGRHDLETQRDTEVLTLATALKFSYARGYPLLGNGGIIRRPDWLDALIDQSWLSHYRRMWLAAWKGRYPLDMHADEIVYPWRDDDWSDGPLGADDPYKFGGYKIKRVGGEPRRAPYAEWLRAHQDGRDGRWWDPVPSPVPTRASGPLQPRPAAPSTGRAAPTDWLTALLGD